jgi:hypothetical protein
MGVCLTKKQEQFFKFVQNYHKENGTFPTPSQASRLLKKTGSSISSLYGTLLLKGAFTDTGPLTDSAQNGHSGGIRPLDITQLKFNPRTIRKGRPASSASILRKVSSNAKIADALVRLLRTNSDFDAIFAGIND